MPAKIINGKELAQEFHNKLKKEIDGLKEKSIIPGLAVIIVGHDPASEIYVKSKEKTAKELGMNSWVYSFKEDILAEEIVELIEKLNRDKKVNGILVQLPLPKHINEEEVIESIDPEKDVDCFHPENVGKMLIGRGKIFPCTPLGIMEMLRKENIEIAGKKCIVVGRSNIVGKPMAMLLLNSGGTVTVCHSKTYDLKSECLRADILITAVGKPGLIKTDMIKEGAVVIDVGINRLANGKVVGDVDFEAVKEKASLITPVPGGVGPMTIAMLMKNTVEAARLNG